MLRAYELVKKDVSPHTDVAVSVHVDSANHMGISK